MHDIRKNGRAQRASNDARQRLADIGNHLTYRHVPLEALDAAERMDWTSRLLEAMQQSVLCVPVAT
jgi:hypothetical protein